MKEEQSPRSPLEKFTFALSLLVLASTISGTKACTEDYVVAGQATSPSVTATPGDDGDNGTTTRTPTPSATRSPTANGTSNATVTPTPSSTQIATTPTPLPGLAFLRSLETLQAAATAQPDEGPPVNGPGTAQALAGLGGNWLGDAFGKDGEGEVADLDADGFTDALETRLGSDPRNEESLPALTLSTKLVDRLRLLDSSMGSRSIEEELRVLVERQRETMGGRDPDADGLGSVVESKAGTDPRLADTDADGLTDGEELALGTNALGMDSDGDGVLDGKEVQLGSDPLLPD